MPSKACNTLFIQPYPICYALLGFQEGNTITVTTQVATSKRVSCFKLQLRDRQEARRTRGERGL